MNIKLRIAYDGTDYLGWQKTHEGPSIEGTLEKILEQVLQEKIHLQAASRTDAGVHALGQVVNFIASKFPPKLQYSLNSLLPKDIVVRDLELMPEYFHPTLDCRGKEYHYGISRGSYQLPQQRHYAWHVHAPLDLEAMSQAAKLLVGQHDFAAFTNAKKNEVYEDTIREVKSIELLEADDQLKIIICGNNFLYKMVRNLVGTIVYVGMGKLTLSAISSLLTSHDRTQGGITAPAHGLTLKEVFY